MHHMQHGDILRFALFALILLLPSAPASAAVTNGSFGLQLNTAATNDVWADPPPPNRVFDRWLGDAALLANPYAWHTTVVMPASVPSLAAAFKPAPAWTTATNTLNGLAPDDPKAVNLIYYSPTNPAGLIFFFNGARASASTFFIETENFAFARDAVAAGYAVASLDSADRSRSWDTTLTAGNADVTNVQAALNYFIARGLITTNTPKFAAGMSAGGFFAPVAAYYLRFNACAIWCSSGAPSSAGTTIFNLTTVPTIWNLARNDDLYNHKAFLGDASHNLALLAARGIMGELRENPPSPVYPERFRRIQGLSAPDSQAIHDQLKAAGLLDDVDFLISSPFNNSSHWQSAVSGYVPYFAAIQDQLNSCYSEHHFFSDFGNKTLQFFGARRPPVAARSAVASITRQAGGTLNLTIAADPGQDYRLEASPDLKTWTPIFTNTYSGGTFDFLDADTSVRIRFYRTSSP